MTTPPATTSNMAPSAPKRHPKFYFEDGNVVFLTSDKTLFRLHKSVLRLHSTFFNDMFEYASIPVKDEKGNEIPAEGSSDEHPIELGGHALATLQDRELESICTVLYEMQLTPAADLHVDQAAALLQVSSKFQFEAIHSKVVQSLDKAHLPPEKRYKLGIDCLIDSWVLRSYVEICIIADPISTNLVSEFSLRNESSKFSTLIMTRESYRTKLLVFAHSSSHQYSPYPEAPENTNSSMSSLCSSCLSIFKQLLLRILQHGGLSDLDGAEPATFPLLEDRMLKGIQPRLQNPLSICVNCRAKEKAAVAQVLGTENLIKEVKRVMNLVS